MTLYDLQEGDEVLMSSYCYEQVCKVSRVTKCYIIIGNTKFRKKDGVVVSCDTWNSTHISIVTSEDLERIKNRQRHERLVLEAKAIPFQSLSNEQLQSIIDIVSNK